MAEKTPPLLFRWRAAIRDSARSSTERLVAHVLSDYGNEHGEDIFPSVARLAHDSGLSDKCVRKTLKSLRGAGWLDWTERYNARGQDASLYRLLIPKDFAPDPFDPETERRSVSTPTETEPSSVTDPSETERRSSETEPGSSRDGTSFTTTSPSNSPLTSSSLVPAREATDDEIAEGEPVDDDDRFEEIIELLVTRQIRTAYPNEPTKVLLPGMRKKVRDNTIVPTFGEAVREAIRRHPELSASEIADAAPRRETSGERIARLVDEVFSGRSPFTVGGVSGSTRAGLRLQMICQYCDGTDETCAWIGNYRHIFLCSSCGESGRHRSDCKVDRAAE